MKRGFTMIELLASVALFMLLVLVGAALVSSATGVSRTTKQRTALRKEARQVFDRMSLDFVSAVRFDTYQLRTTNSGTNSILTLLASSSPSGSSRLQRIDYQVSTNGLFRSVRDLGWNESQDLSSAQAGSSELLSPNVALMIVQTVLSDGTTVAASDTPALRSSPRPIGVRVGLALVDTVQRKDRGLVTPTLNTTNGNPWVYLDPAAEKQGWRASEKTFRLP